MVAGIVFFDCDGTLTTVKNSWKYLHKNLGLWDNNAERYQRLFLSGRIDYYDFCRRDALLWRGTPLHRVNSIVAEIPYQPGARLLVSRLRGAGFVTVIVSTGLSVLVERVRRELSIDLAFSNDLIVAGDTISGEISINVHYDGKGRIVRDVLESFGFSREDAAAVGDGEGDRGMFEEVGLPIGFNMNGNFPAFPTRTRYVECLSSILPLLGVNP